jgi:HPt (histidine-containing phosphotransfer) domain-containing protein
LHTLKGDSGTLGALEIMGLAEQLEHAIPVGKTALEEPLATLADMIEALVKDGRSWL